LLEGKFSIYIRLESVYSISVKNGEQHGYRDRNP